MFSLLLLCIISILDWCVVNILVIILVRLVNVYLISLVWGWVGLVSGLRRLNMVGILILWCIVVVCW